MKIALLTDSDAFAGTERHMLDLAWELRALGEAPVLVCPSGGPLAQRGRAEDLPVLALEKRGGIDLQAIRQISRWLTAGTFDLIHAHNGRTALLAALARRLSGRGAVVATQHFLAPARTTRRGPARLAGRLLHYMADQDIGFHIAISRAVGDAMLARAETDPAKIRVVLNGIRDPRPKILTGRAGTRAHFSVSPDQPLIVCLARLEAEKGVDTLLEAMRIVAGTHPGVRCLIAGKGSLEGALQESILRGGLTHAVQLLGFVEDPLSLLAAADLFVLPSLAEPFGLSIVEAMALGLPVVATRAGGPLEIVREGATGRLTPPGQPESLAAALTFILDDKERAVALGEAARQDYLARFTAARMAREIAGVYREALADGKNRGRPAGTRL